MNGVASKIEETIGAARLQELNALYLAGDYGQVVADAGALIEQTPDLYALHLLQGLSFTGLEQIDKAIAAFDKTLELEPGQEMALIALAACLRRVGRTDEAIACLAENFYLRPSTKSATSLILSALKAYPADIDMDLVEIAMKGRFPRFFARYPDLDIKYSPCMHVADWCEKYGHDIVEYDAGGEVALIDAAGIPLRPYRADAWRSAVVSDACVMPGWDLVVTPTGEALHSYSTGEPDSNYSVPEPDFSRPIISDSGFVPYLGDFARGRVFHPWSKDVIEIDQDVLLLGAPDYHQFGHWIYDFLPRLRARRRADGAALKILTLATLPAAQRETLSRFGVEPQDLIEGETGKVYRCRSLTIALRINCYRPLPSLVRFLYQALAPKKEAAPPGINEGRYFLERSQTNRGRLIANPEELSAVLDDFQVQSLRRPELSVDQQDALFADAGIIICPFGGDFVTQFQLRPGTDFIILQFEDMESTHAGVAEPAQWYSAILEIRTHIVRCGLKKQADLAKYHGDLIVDCAELRETLARVIAARRG